MKKPVVNGAVKIDKKVPIPARAPGRRGGAAPYWPFAKLAVGDSFMMEGAAPAKKMISRGTTLAAYHRKKTGYKFTCRTVEGGVRIWRVA